MYSPHGYKGERDENVEADSIRTHRHAFSAGDANASHSECRNQYRLNQPTRHGRPLMTNIDSIHSILIVADSETQRDLMRLFFSARGFNVETASGGFDAIDKFEFKSFDLVLNDLQVPGCGGNLLADHLSDTGRSVPMIAIASAECHAHPHHRMVLQKPLRMETLFLAIADITGT